MSKIIIENRSSCDLSMVTSLVAMLIDKWGDSLSIGYYWPESNLQIDIWPNVKSTRFVATDMRGV